MSDLKPTTPGDLLRDAAKLVEAALRRLDVAELPCPHCARGLFHNYEQARAYESLLNVPKRLRDSASTLDASVDDDGNPRESSRGYTEAVTLKRGRPAEGG